MPKRADLNAVISEAVGIYGAAPTCHLSALARMDRYKPAQLARAVEAQRSLVRVRAMRRSVYLLGRDLLPVALAATRREVLRPFYTASRRITDYEKLARKVERVLANGLLPAAAIREKVDPDKSLGSRFTILLGRMGAECRIVRAGSTGGWRSDRLTYARWKDWLPDVRPDALDEGEAKRGLAKAYVAAYGPVELDDLAWWAGWSKKDARAVADGLDLDREGKAMRRLGGVRLLPVWDALMVAYRQRARLLDSRHAAFVYDRLGNATSVVLDSGRVVGVWALGKSDDPLSVHVAPFGRWPKGRWEAVAEQADRIRRMIGAHSVELTRHKVPVSLHEAPRNRFLSPLA